MTTTMFTPSVPHSPHAEDAVVGRLLARPSLVAEVVTLIEPSHFALGATRLLYAAIRDAHFANAPIDALTIGNLCATRLAALWDAEPDAAVARVVELAGAAGMDNVSIADHARIIRHHAERRMLLDLSDAIRSAVERDEQGPEAIAGMTSQRAMQIATDTVTGDDMVSFADAGRNFLRRIRDERETADNLDAIGVYTGISAIDDFTKGIRPGRLYIAAGEPGVGKTAVYTKAAMNFAQRQSQRPAGDCVGALFISLEMGEHDSSGRFAQMLTGVNGDDIAMARITDRQLAHIAQEWGAKRDLPLWINYSPKLRTSQILALTAEAIRNHNVGLVLIDHFRMFDLDKRLPNRNDEDEEKVRFLKEDLARSLNVAVICLAHTRKPETGNTGGRPQLADLRGSYQIQAHADYVAFLYRPALYATERDIEAGDVDPTAAEIIYRKNRHSAPGTGHLTFDPETMVVY